MSDKFRVKIIRERDYLIFIAPRKLPFAVVPSAFRREAMPARNATFSTSLKFISVMLVTVPRYPTIATMTAEITAPYKSLRLSLNKFDNMIFVLILSIEAIDNYTILSYLRHTPCTQFPI